MPKDHEAAVSRPVRVVASYVMDSDRVPLDYSNELHELAARAGRALTNAADDVQVLFVDASDPSADVERTLRSVDGVLILGGMDVDPHRYTSDPVEIAGAEATDPVADAFEASLINLAADRGLPVLGICRGAQAMNVALGGTLIADLGADTMHVAPDSPDMLDHDVTIDAGTRLRGIYGAERIGIRSAHHQAVRDLAPGMRASACAPDGVVEAFEAEDDRWIVGVQWHPEDAHGDSDHLDRLAEALVAEARKVHPSRLDGRVGTPQEKP